MKKIIALTVALIPVALTGCQQDRCATASSPAECRSWTDAGGDINDYLIGGMVGYMMANRGGQTIIVRNPGYHGVYRPLQHPLMAENAQLRAKVERQRVALRQQQTAIVRRNDTIRSMKSTTSSPWRSMNSGYSARPTSSGYSFRSSGSFSSRSFSSGRR